MCEADLILALDWMDLGGALRQAKNVGTVNAKIIACSLDQNLHTGANMEYQELPPVDVFAATTGDTMVAELIGALGEGRKDPWKAKLPAKKKNANGALTMEVVTQTLRDQFNDPENVTFCTLGRGWPFDIWPLQSGMSYLGKDGGGGLGSGPGISVGSALALHHKFPGRYAISMLGDGDFCMGATAIWSAAKHRIPLLVIVNNNRSYFNDELHQDHVAKDRGREPKNRWIGLAHGRSGAKHRQACRSAGRGRHRAGHHAGGSSRRHRQRCRRAQERRRLRDRLPHRSAGGAPGQSRAGVSRYGLIERHTWSLRRGGGHRPPPLIAPTPPIVVCCCGRR